MKKSLLMILALLLVFASGCTSADNGQSATSEPGSGTERQSSGESAGGPAKEGTVSEIIVAVQSDGKSLDPHKVTDAASMHYIENMYSTLMQYTDTYGEVQPGLAERYEISDDQLSYTFHLRKGVKFHNSDKEVTAYDVKYSIERIIEHEVRKAHFELLKEIETPDEHTVIFHMEKPFAPFLTYLAYPMNAIVNRETVEANGGSLDQADAGSGPFQLVEWKKDQHLILEKNPSYYEEGKPYLDRIVFKPIPDETARTTAIRNKEVDLILETSAKEAKILENSAGVVVKSVPGTFWEYIGLNTASPKLSDSRVRQAIAHAVDREALNKVVKLGRATVLEGGNIPPSHWANPDLHIYSQRDVDKAKQLLAEAGVEKLKLTLKAGSDFQYQVDAAQMIKQQLADIGIEVEVLAQESGIFFDALGTGDFEMAVVGWLGFVDPDEFVYNIFHSSGPYNQQAYANPRVDELLELGRTTHDNQQRKAIYAEIQQILAEEAPMVFLYVNEQTSAYVDGVEGFVVHPTVTTLSLKNTRVNR